MASNEAKIAGCGLFIYFTVMGFILFLVAKMFAFSFWFVFGKNVPWYLDLAGGIVLNALNLPIWVITMIMYVSGVQQPLVG